MASLGWKGHLKDSNLVLNCKTGKTEAYSMPSPYIHLLVGPLQHAVSLYASRSAQVISFTSGVADPSHWGPLLSSSLK